MNSSFSLAQLLPLSLEARCDRVLQIGQNVLNSTLETLREEGAPVRASMDAERLAWAVGFNIDGAPVLRNDSSAEQCRGMQGYRDHWPLNTKWSSIWSALIQPRAQTNLGSISTLLGDLALSVACEQCDEWQNPAARPVDPADANRAFEFVYARNKPKVVGHVYSSFGNRAGNPEAIADEAWSRVFCGYWSVKPRRRFLGLCRISTLICQVSRYVASDVIRERGRIGGSEKTDIDGESRTGDPSLEDLGIRINPEAQAISEEFQRKIRECVAYLPARQRIVVEMVWFRQVRAKCVAETLHVSKAAVSQHLKNARDAVRNCLREKGFDVPR
jgi:RNA polymerase sigma factor (sigma-70 family)